MLPVAELHLHIEGTLEPELMTRLARRNGLSLPDLSDAELAARYDFADLQGFLDVYYDSVAVLRTEEDFYDLATAYLRRASAAGVRRAEIFFDPQTHLGNGVPFEVVINGLSSALTDARSSLDLSADLIMCFLRDLGGEAAMETLRTALPYREHFIGIGLDSAEVGYPPSLFKDVYALAAAEGLHRVAHAGEEGGPDYVWDALDNLGVERIDHGNRALEDPNLVARLRDERIPLTVCPLSNVSLKSVATLAEHPLPAMLDAGLFVTINSDDPAYFGGYVDDNFTAIQKTFNLTPTQLTQLAQNSFEAAFITPEDRTRWTNEIQTTVAARETE